MQKIFYVTFSSIPSELPSSLQIIKTCESFVKNNYEEKPWGEWTNYTRSQLTSGKELLLHENDLYWY